MFPCDLILASQHVFTGQLYFNTFFYNIPSLYTSPVHNQSQFKIQNSDWASKLNYDFDFDNININYSLHYTIYTNAVSTKMIFSFFLPSTKMSVMQGLRLGIQRVLALCYFWTQKKSHQQKKNRISKIFILCTQ